jgi:hypothetical protein
MGLKMQAGDCRAVLKKYDSIENAYSEEFGRKTLSGIAAVNFSIASTMVAYIIILATCDVILKEHMCTSPLL